MSRPEEAVTFQDRMNSPQSTVGDARMYETTVNSPSTVMSDLEDAVVTPQCFEGVRRNLQTGCASARDRSSNAMLRRQLALKDELISGLELHVEQITASLLQEKEKWVRRAADYTLRCSMLESSLEKKSNEMELLGNMFQMKSAFKEGQIHTLEKFVKDVYDNLGPE